MRRYYNNGTSFVEALTKGTPIGAVGSIVKKIKKYKEDKESRNPDPKTPKMMGKAGADLTKKENTFSKEKIDKFFENKKNKKVITAKNLSELRSGELKTLPISKEQQNNKGKKKLQSAFKKD